MQIIDYTEKFKIPKNYFEDQPWDSNPIYFRKCRMSLLALTKILNHA